MEAETEETLRSSVNHENGDEKNPCVLVRIMKTKTEEPLRSDVNHENRDGRILTFYCEP